MSHPQGETGLTRRDDGIALILIAEPPKKAIKLAIHLGNPGLIIGVGLLLTFNLVGIDRSLFTICIGHVVINVPITFAVIYSQLGVHQIALERAARDLGANEWQVISRITLPTIAPALLAALALAITFSWDEFIIAFLLSRFDVTLPVEIWSMLRRGVNPQTNAVGTFVFAASAILFLTIEILFFRLRRRRSG